MKLSRNVNITLLILVNIFVDQISKFIVRANILPRTNFESGERIHLINNKFILMNVENSGAFLGMGSDLNATTKLIFLLILPTLVLGYLIYYIVKTKTLDKLSLIGLCCIAGGGIANVFDRIVYGSVTDFFYIEITELLRTGIFNLADVSVTSGMVMILIASFKARKNQEVTA